MPKLTEPELHLIRRHDECDLTSTAPSDRARLIRHVEHLDAEIANLSAELEDVRAAYQLTREAHTRNGGN